MKDMIRKIAVIMLAFTLFQNGGGCAVKIGMSKEQEPLTDYMTEAEKGRSFECELQLLDDPWDTAGSEDEFSYLKSTVGMEVWDAEDYITDLNADREYFTQEEYDMFMQCYTESPDEYEDQVNGIIINGELYYNVIPDADCDGEQGEVTVLHYNVETGESYSNRFAFGSREEFNERFAAEMDTAVSDDCVDRARADKEYDDMMLLFDAMSSGDVEILPYGTCKSYRECTMEERDITEPSAWEFDRDRVEAISGSIREYHIYDEELDRSFVVHVILPPEYDESKPYPAFVMTDAVWRFNDIPAMYDQMASGEATPMIMVTIGFEYDVDNTDNEIRSVVLCDKKKEFLDFITDNLMPYLDDRYGFDHEASVLMGHSQGGVFAHYAAFNSDRYANRPFGRYIIGSPVFWTPYFTNVADYEEYKTEYGYFERNESADFSLLITGGSMEDQDYEEYFQGNDSTLEGIEHLKERLDQYGMTDYEVKIYEGHHSDYVGDMLSDAIRI